MSVIKTIKNIIYNPNVYIAVVVGALLGGVSGGASGLFSGGFMGRAFQICMECPNQLLGFNIGIFDLNMVAGAIIGVVIGAALGGAITGLVTTFHVYRKPNLPKTVSRDNIHEVLISSLWISIEISIGMILGSAIGSLKEPGIGSAIGALIGIILMLLATFWENKVKK
ncbi:TPA: hypothetical protein RG395_002261 [Legionella pneumophila]|nr:hypothetical protein [Legionella pneumophila]MDW8878090.1 hypothetical protein [Legionella pneumophila subsp. fraseri]MDW8962453.1 hypothetical protein [Legionella pneumophila subsp. fraseri]MDW9036104.1 hypothetical protein [Legionella pneumophila subsp. fraseri]MDW9042468.1 hypothetical protein [Legionella pneumophila subsp. fraseri]MDW9063299.1 hypothetical protein [Legionella pneumophila subsp. fraseri]